MKSDAFGVQETLQTGAGPVTIFRLEKLERAGVVPALTRLPFSIKILLEAVLRSVDGELVTAEDVQSVGRWQGDKPGDREIPFMPARVLLQDFTGVPAVVDLASMRAAMARLGGDPKRINPLVPVDLVVDHSVQVDFFRSKEALQKNAEIEFDRNRERYEFLRWGQKAFRNFRVVPPATGIVHQVNLEYLAKVVMTEAQDGRRVAFPDTVVGTDSHTTMINGLGVLGWGVGGIEAEAGMLGQPLYMLLPRVVGVRLVGELKEGVTATDLVLTVTQILRKKGVVEQFVEYTGSGLKRMGLPDRATLANMSPEYGATCGFFPVDEETLRYLRRTGRTEAEVDLVERYTKAQGLFRTEASPEPGFSEMVEVDLGSVVPSLAGPKRPQDRVALADMRQAFQKALVAPTKDRGFGLASTETSRRVPVKMEGETAEIGHGAVVIAAITSCTNTSNPSVMLAAGLLARKALARGLRVPAYVKTSLSPGSKVVTQYLGKAGLLADLEKLGFSLAGYGCMTCIGNSGPLPEPVAAAINEGKLVAAAVLSGNRNFEGRVHPLAKANYLASPPLVVAFALAGRADVDLTREPLGRDPQGRDVFLADIWPSQKEVADVQSLIDGKMFQASYGDVFGGNPTWNAIKGVESDLYPFQEDSTYVQDPPFFHGLTLEPPALTDVRGARILAIVGDSVTTDHISPAGDIAEASPAGRYLKSKGIQKKDFNSYGARRGNDRIMARGTFANIRLKNLMVPGVEGGVTVHVPSGERMDIFDAAERYKAEGVPLVVIAGKEYGSGSSRDWAAKGPLLLGVRAAIAESYERIHRSNLVGMGILPLQFKSGQNAESLGLTGKEKLTIAGISGRLTPRQDVTVDIERPDGSRASFSATVRIDTPVEISYYRNGGILQTVLRKMLKG
ncbi:MAG TPA: aconitate hydratase AcnA [Candidatus Sulfotelmatobacter sp.]|nr:aconitate hydratase AcnA [Candidatus Sulfotelmatobacter sp.]